MIRATLTLIILAIAFSQHAIAQTQLGATIEDTDSIARIGTNMDLSANGLRLLAGAPNASQEHWLGGKVKVYDFINGTWTQVGQDLLGTQESDYFGTHLSISADGSRFVVGHRNQADLDLPRSIVAYHLEGEQWDTLGQVISGIGNVYYAGATVQMSADGNRIAAFVTYVDEDMEELTAIQVYEWQNDQWHPLGPPIPEPQGFSGISFAGELAFSADGQTVAVNAISNSNFRRFLVYRYLDGEWMPLGQEVTSSEEADLFARSLSISDDGQRVAVGAPRANANGADSGNVTLYDFVDGQWTQVGSNIPGDNLLDQTGASVALSGDGQRLVVGDHYYDEPDFNSGRMRVFQWLENDWVQIGNEVIGEDRADFFGQKVAISQDGTTIAAGAPQGGGDHDTPGQIKVFGNYPWVPVTHTEDLASKLRIFPNPARDFLFVDAATDSEWQLFDMLGKPIRSGKTTDGRIDLQSLYPGIYLLQLQLGRDRVNTTFIKQ